MKSKNISRKALTVLTLAGMLTVTLFSPGKVLAQADNNPKPSGKATASSRKVETYSYAELSIINFTADGVPNGSAHALGVNLKGGVRLTEFISLEAGINWLPFIPELLIPLPLSWMPNDHGVYLNLGAGLRLNLVSYHSNKIVPWVSVWGVAHAVLSDFSVGGSGASYGVGIEGKTDAGKKWQVSMMFHDFTGDLEIHDEYYPREYEDADIRAVALNIGISMK